MNVQEIQESAIWTKYIYLAPKHRRISRKRFHELYEEYVKHPERKEKLLRKLRALSIEQGKINEQKKKKSQEKKKSGKNKNKGTRKK
jgi:hypothetical protein